MLFRSGNFLGHVPSLVTASTKGGEETPLFWEYSDGATTNYWAALGVLIIFVGLLFI
jgi:hypothetical protein